MTAVPVRSFAVDVDGGARLVVRVKPRSARAGVGVEAGGVVVRVHAAPADGKANDAVVDVTASFFGLSRSAVVLVRGQKSRHKELLLRDLRAAAVDVALSRLL